MTRITVVGDALLDVAVTPERPMRSGADVPGDILVGPGGQGANVAVRLARLGVDATLVCALGDDAAGRLVRDGLEADGVRLVPVATEATGSVVILVDPDGERTMLSHRAPFATEVGAALAGDADWIVVSGYVLAEPGAAAVGAALARRAAPLALLGCAVPEDAVDAWRRAARALDPQLVVANRDEADLVAGVASPAALVVTTAPDGAVVRRDGSEIAVERVPATARDTTGAGDAFAAALVAGLGSWPPAPDVIDRAMAAAVEHAAAVAAVPGAQGRVRGEATPVAR